VQLPSIMTCVCMHRSRVIKTRIINHALYAGMWVSLSQVLMTSKQIAAVQLSWLCVHCASCVFVNCCGLIYYRFSDKGCIYNTLIEMCVLATTLYSVRKGHICLNVMDQNLKTHNTLVDMCFVQGLINLCVIDTW
jgi:hypothetical protein